MESEPAGSVSKTLPSRLFNRVTSMATDSSSTTSTAGSRCTGRTSPSRSTSTASSTFSSPRSRRGRDFRVDEIPVKHYKRKYGKSKYGARRFLNGFFDLMTTMFVTRRALNPLHFFGRIAVILFVLGIAPQLVFMVEWMMGKGLHVRPIMLLGFVLVIVAIQILSIGLLAELISARSARDAVFAFKEYSVRGSSSPRSASRPGNSR
jgi:hypothetical protein